MKALPLLLATAGVIAAPSAPPPAAKTPPVAPAPAGAAAPAAARLPGFAAELAQDSPLDTPSAWVVIPEADAWQTLSHASGVARQGARWAYARSLIGRGRGAEAIGVLDVMRADDPDLAMVDAWKLAHGAAHVLIGEMVPAMDELGEGGLTTNAEACAWRLRAAAELGRASDALTMIACARPALVVRSTPAREPFLLAIAHAAVNAGKPDLAMQWLAPLPDRDAAANLYRGRALGLLGQGAEARLRLARVEQGGTTPQRMDARLSLIEIASANGWIPPAAVQKRLEALRFVWRGDEVEERALQLGYRIASQGNDLEEALRTGATLYRFFDPARQPPGFVEGLQAKLGAALDPATGLPLDKAAGLFWDYRDLMPGGAAGDQLVAKLGDRLQAAGLYERAAELFEHQLLERATDLTQGPLSVKVASLFILAGRPDRAVVAMRKTAKVDYPDAMLFARKRVEAVALDQLGRTAEAFAVLQDVPDGAAIRSEFAWRKHDWNNVVAETASQLPRGRLDEVGQAIVLRRAIALAMLGQENDLAALHGRYADAFAHLASGPAFAMLTAEPKTVSPASLAKAMAALPAVSPVGDLASLIEAGK